MEANEEVAKVAGADKIDVQNITNNFDKQYEEMLKKEQEVQESKIRGEATMQFDNVRKLGFATKSDVDESIKGIFGKFVSEIEAMRKQNTELREWVMRAKQQGLTSGALDQKNDNEVSDYLKPYLRSKPNR
jgi:hypothetical protein